MSVQLTPLLVGSLLTVTVNCCVAAAWSLAELGLIETESPRIVTLAEADFEVSVTEVAVSVTVSPLRGIVLGAV